MLIDTHCHIHDKEFFPDNREDVYNRSIEAGVSLACVGTSQSDSVQAIKFAELHDNTWAVVGVHPHDAKDGWGEIETLIKQGSKKLIGVGEIGLDYFYDNSPRDIQIKALEQQLQWAVDNNLPVSFHVRDAYDDFWPIFDNFKNLRGVLHSFTDTIHQAEQALSRGLYIGVNGISTFTKDISQQAMFDSIPLGNMLLETDAPFLTPVPYRGKVNEPALVRSVAQYHADRRGITLDDISTVTSKNAEELFHLKK